MSFRYFVVRVADEPDRPRGLMAVNRDKEAGRLDMMVFSHRSKEWESDPDAVGLYLFGDDSQDRLQEVRREDAEWAATLLGTTIPSEADLMRISDEAEQERAARRLGDGPAVVRPGAGRPACHRRGQEEAWEAWKRLPR